MPGTHERNGTTKVAIHNTYTSACCQQTSAAAGMQHTDLSTATKGTAATHNLAALAAPEKISKNEVGDRSSQTVLCLVRRYDEGRMFLENYLTHKIRDPR